MNNVLILMIAALVIVLIVLARKSRPAKNKSGQYFSNPNMAESCSDKEMLCVATYNIQAGKNVAGDRDITRSANVLKDVDLAGIQEIHAPSFLNKLKIGRSQARAIAQIGSFSYLFSASQTRWLREHRGNAMFSKLKVQNWRTEMLPDQSGKNYRNMTVAKVQWKDQSFHFINTHINTRYSKEQQLEFVLNEFAKYPKAILVGDFNSRPNTPLLIKALKNSDITDTIGQLKLNDDEENRVDWILSKGFDVHSGKMLARGISDHPYYQVYLSSN